MPGIVDQDPEGESVPTRDAMTKAELVEEVAGMTQQRRRVAYSQRMQGTSDVHAHSFSPGIGGRNCRDGSRHSRIVNGRFDERETLTTASIETTTPDPAALA